VFAGQDVGLDRLDLGLDIGRDLVLELVVGGERGAALGHHRPLLVVLGGELAVLDQLDGVADGRFHMPERGGDDDVLAVLLLVHVVDVAKGDDALLAGRIDDAGALGIEHVDAGLDLGEGGLLGLGRVEPGTDEGDLELDVRVDRAGAVHEGMEKPVDLADGIAAHHTDPGRLGHRAGDDAHQVAGLVNKVVEDREVAAVLVERVAHQEGHLRVVVGHFARLAADAEGLADDKRHAAFGIFA
jgi:hypothetical protein